MNSAYTGDESYIKYYSTFTGYNHPLKLSMSLVQEKLQPEKTVIMLDILRANFCLR
jgi:hypothetical protein